VLELKRLKYFYEHAVNLGLRGITILLRFLLVFGISKYFPTEQLGVYGLFNTTINVTIFFLGFDFYAYAHREMLKSDMQGQPPLLFWSLIFFLFTYLLVLPSCLLIFFYNVLPWEYLGWFYVILVLEHSGQELYRLFIVIGKQTFANLLLFLRTAAWVVPVLLLWYQTDFTMLTLNQIFRSWAVGALGATIIGVIVIARRYRVYQFKFSTVDWDWIKRGISVSILFLGGTLAYKVIEFSDRYFLDYFLDKNAVGVYTFYYNFANVLQTLVFTLVVAQLYPKLAEYRAKGQLEQFQEYKSKFKRQVITIALGASAFVFVIILPAIHFIGKPEFYDHLLTYVILIGSVTLLSISFVPHYILYAMNKDKILLIATAGAACINIFCNIILTKHFGLIGSASSTFISYLFLVSVKFYYVNKSA
jgi:O-antigen/teichoic acid export membrane protein